MKARAILVNYVGIPDMFYAMMPDIGLALLSSCLKENGHHARIVDYCSIDGLKALVPPAELSDALVKNVVALSNHFNEGNYPPQSVIDEYHRINQKVEKEARSESLEKLTEDLDKIIKQEKPDFIAFKLWLGEGFCGSVEIAEGIKKRNPNLKIFAGGPHINWFQKHIFDETDIFEALCYGEGDETISMLADYAVGKRRLKDIPNILFKDGTNVVITEPKRVEDLNSLPFPDYSEEVYPDLYKGLDNKINVFMLEESRGCPNACYFCSHPIRSGRNWRTKSAEVIVDEMEKTIAESGSRYFRFSGSNTPVKLQFEVASEILRRGVKVRYSSFGHLRQHKGIDYNIMHEAGCYALFFGLESGSHEIQKRSMNKIIRKEVAKETMDKCRRAGIKSVASLIYPAPFETEQTTRETYEYLEEIKPDSIVASFPGVVIGTPWYDRAQDFGIETGPEKEYIKMAIRYKAKYTVHPSLWNPIPYKVNGKDFTQFTQECGVFINALGKKGFLTQITDETLLLASISGLSDSAFSKQAAIAMTQQDTEKMRELIYNINSNARSVS